MLQLKSPGVYTQIVPSGVRSITGAATSVGLFVGPTVTGIDGRRVRVQSFGEFERLYGGLSQTSNLSYGVLHFFANGGTEAFIVRVPPEDGKAATTALKRDSASTDAAITLTALSAGAASGDIFIEIDSFDIGGDPFTTTDTDKRLFNLTVIQPRTGVTERFRGLSMSGSTATFAETIVNDLGTGSKLVKIKVEPSAIDKERPAMTGTAYDLKPLPTGTFATDVKGTINLAIRDATGADDAAAKIAIADVLMFAKDSPRPLTARELAARTEAAINSAIRADQALAAKMEGVGIAVSAVEGGSALLVRTTSPSQPLPVKRLLDATVTIVAPSAGTSFVAQYINAEETKFPSRYRLGTPYLPNTEQVKSSIPGAEGKPHGQPKAADIKTAIQAFETVDPFFNLLCLPDLARPKADDPNQAHHGADVLPIYQEAARICAKKFAFLLIDPPPGVKDVNAAELYKVGTLSMEPASARSSALYFPNIRVDDPLQPGMITERPPSGAMAGLFARTDAQYGVWQAPAGTEAVVSGAYGPAVELSDAEHGTLNVVGVNVIRKFPIFGVVSYGSRTCDGANAAASEWKYVPVIRTANYILRSLSEGLRWAVHKPNGEVLWSQLRLNTTAFMHGLFRQGAFKGISAREAYFVMCDASTTSPTDMDQGIVNIQVGFAPLKPAEFVVITLRQIVQPAV